MAPQTYDPVPATFGHKVIKEIIPHREPILLVDRVVEWERNKTIVAEHEVKKDNPLFRGHFPGRPVYPGVYQIEALAQAAAVLTIASDDNLRNRGILFRGIEKAVFRGIVSPDCVFQARVSLDRIRGPLFKFSGDGYVDGKKVVEVVISAIYEQ